MRITRKKRSGCKCIDLVNDRLSKDNAELDLRIQMNFSTGIISDSPPLLSLRKIDQKKRRTRLPTVVCTFCPFCGRKYK